MRFLTTFSSRVLNAHVLVMKHDELCRETWMIDDTDRVNKFPEWRHDGETIPRGWRRGIWKSKCYPENDGKRTRKYEARKSILNGLKSIVRRILAILKLL